MAFIDQSSLKLDQFKLLSAGLEISLKGKIKGDVLKGKNLELTSKVNIQGDVQTILQRLKIKKDFGSIAGGIEFSGELDGKLGNFLETVRADGVFKGKKIRFQDWYADEVYVAGKWLSAIQVFKQLQKEEEAQRQSLIQDDSFVGPPLSLEEKRLEEVQFGQLAISKIQVKSRMGPRVGPSTPGRGGELEVGEFMIPLGRFHRLKVPVKLKNVHLHWLAAPILKDVYPLDFRATGSADLQVTFEEDSSVSSIKPIVDLSIRNFVLDNQKLNQKKEISRLLQIPNFKLQGSFELADEQFKPGPDLKISMDNTELNLSGSVGSANGYDLTGQGKIDLADFGSISEVPIHGDGEIKIHVHGPTDKLYIDFYPNVKEASYLGLLLGDMDGKIIWEDWASVLRFDKVKLKQGRTRYLADGHLDLDDRNQAFLDFHFKKGDISDLSHIFINLVQDIWWFPQALTGEFDGVLQVREKLDVKRLLVKADIKGKDWDYYGERLSTISLKGRYDKGLYAIDQLRGSKYRGQMSGSISFNENTDELKWNFQANQFTLNDFDHVARLDVPIRGKINLRSEGEQSKRGLISRSEVRVGEVAVRGVDFPSSQLKMFTDKSVLKLSGEANGKQGRLELAIGLKEGARSKVYLEANKLDFSPIVLLLNPSLIQDPSMKGHVSGLLDLKFRSGESELSSGRLHFSNYLLQKKGYRVQLEAPKKVNIKDGSFSVKDLVLTDSKDKFALNLHSRRGRISGDISGRMSLSVLEFVASEIQAAKGYLATSLKIGGSLKEPWLQGRVSLNDGSIKLASFEQTIESLTGEIVVARDLLKIKSIEGTLSGGPLQIFGEVELFRDRLPRLDVDLSLKENRIAIYPFQYMTVSGGLKVGGQSLPYLVSGDIGVSSGISRVKMLASDGLQARKSSKYSPTDSVQRASDMPLFKLDINVKAPRGLLVKNDLFDAELSAAVNVVNTIDAPRLLGESRLLSGKMKFKDQEFSIRSAQIRFDNPNRINPKFNLNAFTQIKKTKINLYASGSMEKWKIDLNSDPAKPESEILQLLALGLTPEDMKRLKGEGDTLLQQGEAMMLLLHSLDFNRNVKEKTGFEIELQESYDTQSPNRIFENPTTQETYSAPKIVIKRKIGEKVGISLGTTVGVGNVTEREVNAEFEVSPGISVNGVWNDFEGGTEANTNKQESFGVDLKFQKRFK